jgi:uncharacterized protein (TIGR04551 family)
MLRSSLAAPLVAVLALSSSAALGQGAPGGTAPPSSAPPTPTPAPSPAPAPPTGGTTIERGQLLEPTPAPRPGAPSTAPAPAPGTEPREAERTKDVSIGANPREIYAEDWWVRSHPILEFHGYLRVRAELFHGFALGRADKLNEALWPQPADNAYADLYGGGNAVRLCGDNADTNCEDKSQAGANMRFRINPEIHVSDNVRILSQIDMLDNLVLGSTPGGFANTPAATGGYKAVPASPYAPIGGLVANTQIPPTFGLNSFVNSIAVKRAWGEYATPLGQLRFGRQPSHWGLGILENSGDTFDSDWQSTVDRIMFTTGIKSLDLYVSGAWDFPNEGATSANLESTVGGQPYDLAQLDDVNQYVAMIARRRDPELARFDLAHGKAVVNGGAYFQYRSQYLAAENTALGTSPQSGNLSSTYVRRGLYEYIPDLWFQLLYKKFRFEAEGVMVAGYARSVDPTSSTTGRFDLLQWGVASQTEFRAMEDRLSLDFGFGWASGDQGLLPQTSTRQTTLSPLRNPISVGARVPGNTTYSEFRFHPDYRIDLIFNRNILGRIQGEYYFRPSVDYDFTRTPEGQKLGGGAAVIWSRASEFVQTPGHKRDLGLEFDLSLYYQSKDGSLNDNPNKMGGFFTMAQYGVFFPFGGLSHLPTDNPSGSVPDTTTAHIVRWLIGILY